MVKPLLYVSTDVMSTVGGGKATAADAVPPELLVIIVIHCSWQVEKPLWQVSTHILVN